MRKLYLLCLSLFAFNGLGQTFVAVDKPSKIFDEPNVKGFVTMNTQNQEVSPLPGMVFKSLEFNNGWHLVEYSPGLKGFLSDQRVSKSNVSPAPGVFSVANATGQKLKVAKEGDKWTAEINGKKFEGILQNNVVLFYSDDNRPAYSLVNFGEGPIVMSYDNNITKFF